MRIERLPLNALRAFAEAVRENSFKAAASRLGVTPGAVSRQVKQLEGHLGVALFERHANGVRATEAGRGLAEDVQAGLLRIASGVQNVTERSEDAFRLLLSAPPSFLQLWLLPRLPGFEAQERQIEISLDAEARLTPPLWMPNRARLSLRYGQGPWPGVTSQRLFEDTLFPVCSPTLLTQEHIHEPADLLAQTLLTVDWCSQAGHPIPSWQDWLKNAGVAINKIPHQRQYSLYSLALDQAMAGQGVVLASYPLVADRLASGVLVRPFAEQYPLASPFAYELILPSEGVTPPAVARFIEWLEQEAARFRGAAR
ncbi:LysR substrate-binding domain-containing protein [Vreelandella janggokensis]|jgi:LysR family glycine cleavage system transcriptional activator|uniref:LysR substrate-binding domain-containing protein n=1 Tax=Vreelandella janggokensis TaxID=370767 RepID=A0ABT4IQN4_9GAMM|nr:MULTISPECIES: LysR substrate-binding domain-containing protein [Halomonas]MCW4149891.1 LysR substrate-binding domain-containing protein [Halomonas sp. 18H]MCZ0925975.1 LysR substrate-binding domain-containing protein [Halomonas janggokensis]MCZ0931042.1 LysR substrate-binding domain-containing protein [Halomonas janggokensis]MDR5886456.1 LysR substrate-binding domain-containing protein [Halomonas janggokensis]